MNASFIHRGGEEMASYRYRAAIPSAALGLTMNDLTTDILVFAKPLPDEVQMARRAQDRGAFVIVDFCDPHFDQGHYVDFAFLADAITCPTAGMYQAIEDGVPPGDWYPRAIVIADPFECHEDEPHCDGVNLLWFGHGSNFPSLQRVLRSLDDYPLTIVSNLPFTRPWSQQEMEVRFCEADIVILPATASHKSPNRAVEAIRNGCFVVAEPHPSLEGFPGIWIGDLKEGIEWASHNLQEANQRTLAAQKWVSREFSPQTVACAWKKLFETVRSPSTSEAARCSGQAGSMSMASTKEPMSSATCAS